MEKRAVNGCILVGLLLVGLVSAPPSPSAAEPSDEAAIKAFVQAWVDVSDKQDVDGILTLFAQDARIDSLVAGTKVTKETYAGAMKQAQHRGGLGRNFDAKVTSISFPGPGQAVLEMDTTWDTPRSGRRTFLQRWTLAKRDGRRLILETEYLKK